VRVVATVAIPVLNGAPILERTLQAVRAQSFDGELELMVCDSGSRDGSVTLSRRYGAEVLSIASSEFGHGRTRNLLMQRSRGSHVAFLTQDAVPEHEDWLNTLLDGFQLTSSVGLVFGPYRPQPGASAMVARELTEWFRALAPDGRPRVVRLTADQGSEPAREFLGARGFFTDANGCVARSAWEQVPFRDTAYAEDHLLAMDMMRAGFAKVYMPDAAVVHSHDYSSWDWFRRSFDEARAMRDIYDWVEPLHLRTTTLNVWGRVGADCRWLRASGSQTHRSRPVALLARSTAHHTARAAGAILGARADHLSPAIERRLSLERRSG
jgi:glycosyltransferase involved in cell wall biosynthesis